MKQKKRLGGDHSKHCNCFNCVTPEEDEPKSVCGIRRYSLSPSLPKYSDSQVLLCSEKCKPFSMNNKSLAVMSNFPYKSFKTQIKTKNSKIISGLKKHLNDLPYDPVPISHAIKQFNKRMMLAYSSELLNDKLQRKRQKTNVRKAKFRFLKTYFKSMLKIRRIDNKWTCCKNRFRKANFLTFLSLFTVPQLLPFVKKTRKEIKMIIDGHNSDPALDKPVKEVKVISYKTSKKISKEFTNENSDKLSLKTKIDFTVKDLDKFTGGKTRLEEVKKTKNTVNQLISSSKKCVERKAYGKKINQLTKHKTLDPLQFSTSSLEDQIEDRVSAVTMNIPSDSYIPESNNFSGSCSIVSNYEEIFIDSSSNSSSILEIIEEKKTDILTTLITSSDANSVGRAETPVPSPRPIMVTKSISNESSATSVQNDLRQPISLRTVIIIVNNNQESSSGMNAPPLTAAIQNVVKEASQTEYTFPSSGDPKISPNESDLISNLENLHENQTKDTSKEPVNVKLKASVLTASPVQQMLMEWECNTRIENQKPQMSDTQLKSTIIPSQRKSNCKRMVLSSDEESDSHGTRKGKNLLACIKPCTVRLEQMNLSTFKTNPLRFTHGYESVAHKRIRIEHLLIDDARKLIFGAGSARQKVSDSESDIDFRPATLNESSSSDSVLSNETDSPPSLSEEDSDVIEVSEEYEASELEEEKERENLERLNKLKPIIILESVVEKRKNLENRKLEIIRNRERKNVRREFVVSHLGHLTYAPTDLKYAINTITKKLHWDVFPFGSKFLGQLTKKELCLQTQSQDSKERWEMKKKFLIKYFREAFAMTFQEKWVCCRNRVDFLDCKAYLKLFWNITVY